MPDATPKHGITASFSKHHGAFVQASATGGNGWRAVEMLCTSSEHLRHLFGMPLMPQILRP
jgi:hypothetical protein